MNFILYVSDLIIPAIIFCAVAAGLLGKKSIYDDFVRGAKSGVRTVFDIMPTLIGLMVGVGIMRESGLLDAIGNLFGGMTKYVNFPAEIVPVTIVKMFSSSAATGLVIDIFKEYGTDSRIGLITSIMMSSTETIFYTMSVYFLCAKVKKTRYTLAGALIATIAGTAASIMLAGSM